MSATFFIRRREALKKAKEVAEKEQATPKKAKKPNAKQYGGASMTIEELESLNLPIEANGETVLYIEAAIDWLIANTTLDIDKADIVSSVAGLPAGAKLLLTRYYDVMATGGNGIASESIGGMSQSFTTDSKASLLWQLASELIRPYLKGQVHSVPNVSKWL